MNTLSVPGTKSKVLILVLLLSFLIRDSISEKCPFVEEEGLSRVILKEIEWLRKCTVERSHYLRSRAVPFLVGCFSASFSATPN